MEHNENPFDVKNRIFNLLTDLFEVLVGTNHKWIDPTELYENPESSVCINVQILIFESKKILANKSFPASRKT